MESFVFMHAICLSSQKYTHAGLLRISYLLPIRFLLGYYYVVYYSSKLFISRLVCLQRSVYVPYSFNRISRSISFVKKIYT